jgi:hypothetical protein
MLKHYFVVNGDALVYGELAKNLLQHGCYGLVGAGGVLHPTLIRLPGYPLFLALCFRFFGMENYASAAWVQIVLELAGCLLLADFAGRIAPASLSPSRNRGAAHCTLWLAALCPFTAIYAAEPLTEGLTLFMLALALWSMERSYTRPAWGSAFSFTFAVTYAALLRPDGALAAVALAPALLMGLWSREGRDQTAGAKEVAEKLGDSDENGEKHPSGAEAHVDSVGFMRGLKPPPPSASSFPATYKARADLAGVETRAEVLACQPRRARSFNLLRMAMVCMLLALTPFAAWTGRNWQVFHVFEPLAPRYANDPGQGTYPGWQRWVKTWCLDFVCTYDVYWPVPGSPLDLNKLPSRAFDSPAQYAETAEIADDYNDRDNAADIVPDVDARFGKLADERIAAHPLRYYLWLPLGRVADMWLRPRVENLNIDLDWWVYAHHRAETRFSWEYAGLNAFYLLLGIGGLCLRPRFWRPMLAYMVLRSVLLATVEAPEARYTLECFPMLFALGGVALYRFTYWVFESVLKVKASAGKV